jgi:hypothetical protein
VDGGGEFSEDRFVYQSTSGSKIIVSSLIIKSKIAKLFYDKIHGNSRKALWLSCVDAEENHGDFTVFGPFLGFWLS